MQQDQVEVAFCDLCGASVPDVDFGMGMATRLQGKTVGKCCLTQLRAAAPVAPAGPGQGAAHDPRLVPVAIAVLAAVAAATIFLDFRFSESDRRRIQDHTQLVQSQRTDHDAIQRIDVAMDGSARRADLDGFVDKVGASLAANQADAVQSREQVAVLQKDVAALQREVRAAVAASIDYRPLFDDLRTALQRQGAVIAELRAGGAGAPASPVEAASPPKGDAAPAPGEGANPPSPADALPPALAETAKKLASPDPAVRFEAVDELLHSKNPLVLSHLLPLARDADSFVRRLTVEGLRDFKRPEAVEALLGALTDGDERVRDYAWRSLVEMTGQKIAFEAGGSKTRARAVTRWQEWWEKNKATFGS